MALKWYGDGNLAWYGVVVHMAWHSHGMELAIWHGVVVAHIEWYCHDMVLAIWHIYIWYWHRQSGKVLL
jgi:hypothetical protein